MRYYDLIETPKTKKTFLCDGENRIHQDDERVKCWFEPLPEGMQRSYTGDGYPFIEVIKARAPTTEELANAAQSEVITELNWCDLQLNLHASSDKRAVSTLEDIYSYARACRDYVQNIDGVLTIVGDKPVRPT